MPEFGVVVGFVGLAVGEADQFQLHAPGAEEVDPGLAFAGILGERRLAQDADIVLSEIIEGGVHVVHVESQVVAADVGVLRLGGVLVGGLVFENLEVGAVGAAQEFQAAHDGTGVDVEVLLHPIAFRVLEGAQVIERLAAQHVDEKINRLVQVGHGETDVVGAAQAGQTFITYRHFTPQLINHRDSEAVRRN